MGAFLELFEGYGVYSLPDLCDPAIVSDSDLRGPFIGMSEFQVKKKRMECTESWRGVFR
jgi:hypothetical protein